MACCEITQPLLQDNDDSYDESAFDNDAHVEGIYLKILFF